MKQTEIREVKDRLARKGFSDIEIVEKNLHKCDIYFISELNRILK